MHRHHPLRVAQLLAHTIRLNSERLARAAAAELAKIAVPSAEESAFHPVEKPEKASP
jgi:hypothetical protein